MLGQPEDSQIDNNCRDVLANLLLSCCAVEVSRKGTSTPSKTKKGEWDDGLEKTIERTVEAPGLPVLQKLAKGNTLLSWDERTALALLVAFQEVRTPASLQRTIDHTKAMTERLLRDVRAANPTQETIDLVGKDGKKNTVTLAEIEEFQADLEKKNSFGKAEIGDGASDGPISIFPANELHHALPARCPRGSLQAILPSFGCIRMLGLEPVLNRNDVEIRFPVSNSAFLTITHDLNFAEPLIRATEAKRAVTFEVSRLLNL
jgi:hypothetical protein